MHSLFAVLTLGTLAVSVRRKRQFVVTFLLLMGLLVLRSLHINPFYLIPYAREILAIVTYTLTTNVVINGFRLLVVSNHRKRRGITGEEHDNFTVGLSALVNAATVFAAVVFVFLVFNIKFQAFLSSVALFAVALTIIFQDFIKNFLFGLAIMFSADYEIGDYIQVGDMPKGVIMTITFASVQLKTETGDVLFIPNTVIRAHEVLNFSKLKPKRINTEFSLLRSQLTSVDAFEKKLLLHLNAEFENVFELEKCHILIKETTKDEVVFTLEAPTKKASLKLKEQINRAVQKFAVEYKN